ELLAHRRAGDERRIPEDLARLVTPGERDRGDGEQRERDLPRSGEAQVAAAAGPHLCLAVGRGFAEREIEIEAIAEAAREFAVEDVEIRYALARHDRVVGQQPRGFTPAERLADREHLCLGEVCR